MRPPGLKHSLPFYANKPWVKLGSPILLFEYLLKTYGKISCYKFLGTDIVFVNDPDYIREILVTQGASFIKERTVKRMRLLLGEGLITSDEPFHMRQRRIAAPAFHRQRIAAYGAEIVASAVQASARLIAGKPFDVAAASMELSLEIVARTLFDTEVDADIRSINDEVNTIMDLYNFIVGFPMLERFLFLPIPQLVRFRKSKARLDAVVDRLIREHRESMATAAEDGTEGDRGDLLSMLLSSRDELLDDAGNATGEYVSMSDPQVRDEVLTIFLAGYETVANGADVDLVPALAKPRSGGEAACGARRRAWDRGGTEVADPGRLPCPALYGDGVCGGHAALPAGMGDGPNEHSAGHAGALHDWPGRALLYEPVHDGADGRILPGAAEVRSGTVQRGSKGRPAKVCLLPFWRRFAPVHWRVVCLDGRCVLDCDTGIKVALPLCGFDTAGASGKDYAAPA